MTISDEEMGKIESNWKEFEKFCGFLGDRAGPVKEMLEHFGERACTAPASSRIEFHNAFPGGLVDHSLRVLQNAIAIATALKVKVSKESLIISALFHDWGKVGDMDDDFYLPQTSDWHRKTLGQMYTNNQDIKMANAQLGLYTISQFGIKLTKDEYLAILLNDGMYVDENKWYAMKEPALALIVSMADRWSCQAEKSRKSILDVAEAEF